MLRLLLTALSISLCLALPLRAEEASRDQVLKLYELTGVEKQIDATLDSLRAPLSKMLTPALRQAAQSRKLIIPEDFDGIVAEEMDVAFERIKADFLAELVPLHQRAFTEDDITRLIEFYESDLGRRLVATSLEVQKVAGAMGQVIGQQVGQDLVRAVLTRLNRDAPVEN
ncbi:DUF2059 domain-containing protein [Minwuia sp.]|uniref:DUF2059 domain-containing protein n=1 Tax=Minwuia sp. TaxID=2493630 RepID=UPI003A95A424